MKNNTSISLIATIISFLLLQTTVAAQESGSLKDTLFSPVLQQKRPIEILLPAGYKKDDSIRYDVLYVLDGEWNTSLTQKAYQFLGYAQFVPNNVIIVGVPNVYKGGINFRDRDFTPTRTEYSPISGGAANFLSFFKEELIPYINKQYRTKPENSTLYGTSLGGLFATYAFLYAPTLFKSYLTVEPSLWYDNGLMSKVAQEKLPGMTLADNTYWISVRDGQFFYDMGVASFDSVLRQQAPKALDWKVRPYPDETHFSSIWKGLYDGLKFTYKGFMVEDNFLLTPTNGRILSGRPFSLRCYNAGAENYMFYTLDGSEPTASSSRLKYENTFDFSSNTTITVKALSSRKEYEKTIRCNYKVEPPLIAIPPPKDIKKGGLRFKYYKGNWDQLPELNKLKPIRTGSTDDGFDINGFGGIDGFACELEGLLEVPEEGYYVFGLGNNNPARVQIAGQTIIDEQQATHRQSYILYLTKGFYPVKVEGVRKKNGQQFSPLFWRKEGETNASPIAAEYLYH